MTTSVILACYNGEKFILEQLESIRTQSIRPDEVLICDDCSTDNTVTLIQEYISKYNLSNWNVFENETNLGWRINFAKLVLKATKEIVFFCDQDDVWYPNKIEKTLHVFEALEKVQLAVCDLDVEYMAPNLATYNPMPFVMNEEYSVRLKPKNLSIMRPGCAMAVRYEFAQECFKNYWNKELAHDMFIWQCAFLADAIGYVNKPLFSFRRFASSATSGKVGPESEGRMRESKSMVSHLQAAMGISNNKKYATTKMIKFARRKMEQELQRQRFFATKNPLAWLSCIRYLDCYRTVKFWGGDLYHAFKDEV